MCALIPTILLLALHIDNIAKTKLQLNLAIRRIGYNAAKTTLSRAVHRLCGGTGLNGRLGNNAVVAVVAATEHMSSVQTLRLAMIGRNNHVRMQLCLRMALVLNLRLAWCMACCWRRRRDRIVVHATKGGRIQ